MTLYEIDEEILNLVDQETGEIIDIERLEQLEMEREKKISNVGCWIKDLKAEAEALKAEKNNLAKRQTVCENKVEQLKDYLSRALNGMKYKDSRCSISYRKSESVEVDDSVIDSALRISWGHDTDKEKLISEFANLIKVAKSFLS